MTKLLLITGLVVGILAGFALSGTSVGTTGFFLTAAGAALSALLVASTLTYYFVRCNTNDRRLQMLPLPQAQTEEKYLKLLDVDQDNRYSYFFVDLLDHHLGSNNADLKEQTLQDLNRAPIYMLNGLPFSLEKTDFAQQVQGITCNGLHTNQILELAHRQPDPILFGNAVERLIPNKGEEFRLLYLTKRFEAVQLAQIPENVFKLLNQALLSYTYGILQGRYSNGTCNILFKQRDPHPPPPTANTLYEVIQKSQKWYVRLGQIFQIMSLSGKFNPLYVKAELLVDVEARTGELTWSSPQTNQPTLT
ncbi:MAG: hypothetical protein JJU12_06045 [Chlamydiales bacterium]|nr:hypothetical protein [Chlamydiales bacterium]